MANPTSIFTKFAHLERVWKTALVDDQNRIWIDCLDPEISNHKRCSLENFGKLSEISSIRSLEYLAESWVSSHAKQGLLIASNADAIEFIIYKYECRDGQHKYTTQRCASYRNFAGKITKIFKFGHSPKALIVLCKHDVNVIEFALEPDETSKQNTVKVQIREHRHFYLPSRDAFGATTDCCVMPRVGDALDTRLIGRYHKNWAQFTLFLLTNRGHVFTICPIVLDSFEMPQILLDFMHDDVEEADMEIFRIWCKNCWYHPVTPSRLDHLTNNSSGLVAAPHVANLTNAPQGWEASKPVAFDGRACIVRDSTRMDPSCMQLRLLNLLVGNGAAPHSPDAKCLYLTYLDTHSIFSSYFAGASSDVGDTWKYRALTELPLLARTWSDGSVDVIACIKPVTPHWSRYQSRAFSGAGGNLDMFGEHLDDRDEEAFDALLIEKVQLLGSMKSDGNDRKQLQQLQQNRRVVGTIFNDDELVFGLDDGGLHYLAQIELGWLRQVPETLESGIDQYLELLRTHDTQVSELTPVAGDALDADDTRMRQKLIGMMLLRSMQLTEDKIVLVDNAGRVHSRAMISTLLLPKRKGADGVDGAGDEREQKMDNLDGLGGYGLLRTPPKARKSGSSSVSSGSSVTSPVKHGDESEMERLERRMKKALDRVRAMKLQLPQGFSLDDTDSLAWFVKEVKNDKFDPCILQLYDAFDCMLRRQQWISNQTEMVVMPQLERLKQNLKKVEHNQQLLERELMKINEIDAKMKERIEGLQKVFEKSQKQNEHQSNQKFLNVLAQFESDYNAVKGTYNMVDKKSQKLASQRKQKQVEGPGKNVMMQQQKEKLKKSIKHQQNLIDRMKNTIAHVERDLGI